MNKEHVIDIKLGYACNNHCIHCVMGNKREHIPNKTFSQIETDLKKGKALGGNQVLLTGGEPTVRKDFLKIVNLCTVMQFEKILIQTNGRMLSNLLFLEKVMMIVDSENNTYVNFNIPILAHKAELHDSITQVPESFKQAKQAIINIIHKTIPVTVSIIILQQNYKHLLSISELLHKIGVRVIKFSYVHPIGNCSDDFKSKVPRYQNVKEHLHAALSYCKNHKIQAMTYSVPYCYMNGFEDKMQEKTMPKSILITEDEVDADFNTSKVAYGKVKGQFCVICSKNDVCEGVWKEYIDKYGDEEFKEK